MEFYDSIGGPVPNSEAPGYDFGQIFTPKKTTARIPKMNIGISAHFKITVREIKTQSNVRIQS